MFLYPTKLTMSTAVLILLPGIELGYVREVAAITIGLPQNLLTGWIHFTCELIKNFAVGLVGISIGL